MPVATAKQMACKAEKQAAYRAEQEDVYQSAFINYLHDSPTDEMYAHERAHEDASDWSYENPIKNWEPINE